MSKKDKNTIVRIKVVIWEGRHLAWQAGVCYTAKCENPPDRHRIWFFACDGNKILYSGKGDTALNYANIKYCDISNGTGVRTSLFVSGCRRHCENCFNKIAWDFNYGKPFDKEVRNQILASLKPDYIGGLSLLGGEPFEPENQRALVSFLHDVKILYPHKTIWCYTGNVYETELLQPSASRCEVTDEMLGYIDILVDGAFVQDLYDISLRFRGSSNQRIIDMNATRAAGHVVLWQDDPIFADHKM